MKPEHALAIVIKTAFAALLETPDAISPRQPAAQPALHRRRSVRRRGVAKVPPVQPPLLAEVPEDRLGKPDLGEPADIDLSKLFGVSGLRRQSPPPPTYNPDRGFEEAPDAEANPILRAVQ